MGMNKNYRLQKFFFFSVSFILLSFFITGWVLQDDKVKKEDLKLKVEKKKDTKEEEKEEESGPADTVKIGAYVLSVYDLNFPGNKVNVDFYVWYNTKKDSLNLIQYFELVNSNGYNKSNETSEKRGDNFYQTLRINSQIKEVWNVTNFPFDRQKVEIMIEDYDKDNTKLIFILDTAASKIDQEIHIEDWKIMDFGIKTVNHVYETNYGDPDIPVNEYSAYSRVIVYFTLEREGKGLFAKLFVGLFISVLMSLLTFFVNPLDLDPRFGLSVGAIFAAIESQYVISQTLPQNDKITLVDKLHDISFIFIFISILVSTVSLHFVKTDRKSTSQKIDRRCFVILSAAYIIIVLYFVLKAV